MGNRLSGDDCKFWDFYLSLYQEKVDKLLPKVISQTVSDNDWDYISLSDTIPSVDNLIKATRKYDIPKGMLDKLMSVCPIT